MRPYLLCCSIILIFCVSPVVAGVDLPEVPGNTPIPLGIEEIILTKVEVHIIDDKVDALHVFKNASSKEITMIMGYPFNSSTDPIDPLLMPFKDISLNVLVDGEVVAFTRENLADDIRSRIGPDYEFAYVWPVSFAPNQSRAVRCSYDIQWHTGLDFPSGSSFSYIISTGRLWKEAIQRADYILELDNVLSEMLAKNKIEMEIRPQGYKLVDGKTIEWKFTDWEPDENIRIRIK